MLDLRTLLGVSVGILVVAAFGRGSWDDPDLNLLRTLDIANWRPTDLDGEMRFEHPADRLFGTPASIERQFGFTSRLAAANARQEALGFAQRTGWVCSATCLSDEVRTRSMGDVVIAHLTTAVDDVASKRLYLRLTAV